MLQRGGDYRYVQEVDLTTYPGNHMMSAFRCLSLISKHFKELKSITHVYSNVFYHMNKL